MKLHRDHPQAKAKSNSVSLGVEENNKRRYFLYLIFNKNSEKSTRVDSIKNSENDDDDQNFQNVGIGDLFGNLALAQKSSNCEAFSAYPGNFLLNFAVNSLAGFLDLIGNVSFVPNSAGDTIRQLL